MVGDSDCVVGGGWASGFECTTNDPVNEVLIIGSCGQSPSSACQSRGLLTVATVTFTAIKAGVADIGGEVVKLKDDVTTVTAAPIVAGSDVVLVTSARRLTVLDPAAAQSPSGDATAAVGTAVPAAVAPALVAPTVGLKAAPTLREQVGSALP